MWTSHPLKSTPMQLFCVCATGLWKYWASYAILNVWITTLLFTFTVQKYIFPSVIIWMRILNVQVNGPVPKLGYLGCFLVIGAGRYDCLKLMEVQIGTLCMLFTITFLLFVSKSISSTKCDQWLIRLPAKHGDDASHISTSFSSPPQCVL